jgi:hypothetical protein
MGDLGGSQGEAGGPFPGRRAARTLAQGVCTIVIDAEEDFDWAAPMRGTEYSVACMRCVTELRPLLSASGIVPTYMLTYPILDDAHIVSLLRRQYASGQCELGVHLHSWVTPPFDDSDGPAQSYLSNLPAAAQEQKLLTIIAKFRDCFGIDPVMFRAGRYGFNRATAAMLEAHGFAIDTSLAPRTDFSPDGGPDFTAFGSEPFWFGRDRALLEAPLCRGVVGWSGRLAPSLYRAGARHFPDSRLIPAVLGRLRCAERITVSPEGNDEGAMIRFIRRRRRLGQSVFSLSFHSSSLAAGRNPYVRSQADLHFFYDRLSATLDLMVSDLGLQFVPLSALPGLLGGGPA